jgi:hypothetical protein
MVRGVPITETSGIPPQTSTFVTRDLIAGGLPKSMRAEREFRV